MKVELHTFLTSVIDGGGQLYDLAVLPPGKEPPVSIG
jgi:hypothetical protein